MDRYPKNRHFYGKQLIPFLFLILTMSSCASAQQNTPSSDVQWLIEVLELKKGSVVADIGAGDGDQSLEVAEFVGPDGYVYSTELGNDELSNLRRQVEYSELENIEVFEGHPARTNLPDECCDGIYLRRVYHHIGNPASMNASIFRTLKPGGRLAIIDFEPRGNEGEPGKRASGRQHGVLRETVEDELTEAGFELIRSEHPSGRYYYVVFQKPEE